MSSPPPASVPTSSQNPPPQQPQSSSNTAHAISPMPPSRNNDSATSTSTSDSNANANDSAPEVAEDEIFSNYDARCEAEWDAIKLFSRAGKSWVYGIIKDPSLKKGIVDSPLYNSSDALKRIKNEKELSVCTWCKEEGKDLGNCLLKMPNNEATNGNSHLKSAMHKEQKKAFDNEKQGKKRKVPDANPSDKKSTKQSTLGFGPKKRRHKKEVQDELHGLITDFVSNGGFPDTTVKDENLRNVVQFAIDNAHNLGEYSALGIRKYVSMQCKNFEEFITKVTDLVGEVREWWVENTGTRQKFITAAHDVWDGFRNQMNGVTIFFVDPRTMTMYRIPIGLMSPNGKSGEALSASCMVALERVGIERADLFRSVNDNCSTAKKTGRLLLGGPNEANGACDMHLAALMAALALSLIQRKQDGVVINYWPPFQDLYKKAKAAAKYVCDKQHKRFGEYKSVLKAVNKEVRVIRLPNDTRVAGALLLCQDSLRAMHALRYYATKNGTFETKHNLTRDQWKQLAEFEAIMRKAHILAFDVQSDRPETGAEVPLLLTLLKVHYSEDEEFDVVDTSKDWPAETPFEKLPRITMTTKSMNATDAMPLMSHHSIELIERYVSSYEEYFGEDKMNPDRLLAMITHPYLGTAGFEELCALRPDDGDELFEQAKESLKDEIIKRISGMKSSSIENDDGADENDDGADESNTSSSISKLAQLRKKRQQATKLSPKLSSVEERAIKAVEDFTGQDFDILTAIEQQYQRTGKDTESIDWKRVKEFDAMYISSIFDSLEWWKTVGSKQHPLVYYVVLAIVALPASNAFLERIFSTCTRFDDPLRQSLQESRFEMAVLLSVNAALSLEFKSGKVPSDEEEQEIVEKVVRIFEKKAGFNASIDLGIDVNEEDFQARENDDDE